MCKTFDLVEVALHSAHQNLIFEWMNTTNNKSYYLLLLVSRSDGQ